MKTKIKHFFTAMAVKKLIHQSPYFHHTSQNYVATLGAPTLRTPSV